MLKSLRVACVISVAFVPMVASADNQFATAETIYEDDGALIMSTLRAMAWQEPEDGEYVFDGYLLRMTDDLIVPWTVRVPLELQAPNVVAAMALADERIQLRHAYQFEFDGGMVEKLFFEIIGDEMQGVMAVTDDPLPIIGWLVLGSAGTVLGTVGLYMYRCERVETKTIVSVDGSITYETKCEMTR